MSFDILRAGFLKRLVKLHFLQFSFVLIVTAAVVLASITMIYGVRHPAFNFGLVLTWVIWWGLLIGLFALVGRGWCFLCPFGATIDWVQRLSFWWKTKLGIGLNIRYPRRMQNLWLATGLFIGFIFLDAGYGISNNPKLTAGLVIVLVLWALWIGLFFERRTFCRYQCPLTVFIGMSSMFAPFEIRRKDAGVCLSCQTKDCFRGNDKYYGCPTLEFQGAGMDSNRDCILCTECIKACPKDNITMRIRGWGHDLWSRKTGRLDEAFGAVVLTAIVTVVSLVLVLFLPTLFLLVRPLLPAGAPPNDWPRLVSIALIYLGGIALTLLLMYGFSWLSKKFSSSTNLTTRAFFAHFGYAVIPLGVMKFLSDILDHVFRTWGALKDVTLALARDFPFNRLMLDEVTIKQLMSAEQTYLLQIAMIGTGLAASLYVSYKLANRLFPDDSNTAFRSFLPVGAFVFILAMSAVWALSAAL